MLSSVPSLKKYVSFLRKDSGGVLVEFSLVAPVFFIMFLSTFYLGGTLWIQIVLEACAREVIRYAITGQTDPVESREQSITNRIAESIQRESGGFMTSKNVSITSTSYPLFPSLTPGVSVPFGSKKQVVFYQISYPPLFPFFSPNSAKLFVLNESY